MDINTSKKYMQKQKKKVVKTEMTMEMKMYHKGGQTMKNI